MTIPSLLDGTMKAIELTAFGDPTSVLRMTRVPDLTHPGADEVILEMRFAPVNHNDLLLIRGTFPVRPELPATVGNEGLGKVVAIGARVTPELLGGFVLAPLYGRTWAERMQIPAQGLVALPDADPEQLAMLRINPPTASLLLSEYVALNPGDWVIQNAGNSSVGRTVIAFARARGLRTVSLVRRADLFDELKAAGGDVVLLDTDDSVSGLSPLIGDAPVRLALDGVGGTSTARLASALAPGGTLVSYAQMGGIAAPGDLRPLMRKGVLLTSFYAAKPAYRPKIPGIVAQAVQMVADGRLHVPVSAVYPARDFKAAIAHTIKGGKVLLDLGPSNWD